jgi:hypothetical protein
LGINWLNSFEHTQRIHIFLSLSLSLFIDLSFISLFCLHFYMMYFLTERGILFLYE